MNPSCQNKTVVHNTQEVRNNLRKEPVTFNKKSRVDRKVSKIKTCNAEHQHLTNIYLAHYSEFLDSKTKRAMSGYSFAVEKKEHCVQFLSNPTLTNVQFEEEFKYASKLLEVEELKKTGRIVVSNKFRYHVKRFHELPFELLEKEKKSRFYDLSRFKHKLVHNYKKTKIYVDNKKPKKPKFSINVPYSYVPPSVPFKVNKFRWVYMTEYMTSNEFLRIIENKYLKSIQLVADWNSKLKFFNSSHMTNLLHNRLMKYRVNVIMNRKSIQSGKKTAVEMLLSKKRKQISLVRIKELDDKYASIFVTQQCKVSKLSEDRIIELEALTRRLLPKRLFQERIDKFSEIFEPRKPIFLDTFGFCNGVFSRASVRISTTIVINIQGLEFFYSERDAIPYANGIVSPGKYFIYMEKDYLYNFNIKVLPTAYAYHLGVIKEFGEQYHTDLFFMDSYFDICATGNKVPYTKLHAQLANDNLLILSRSLYEVYELTSDYNTLQNILAVLDNFGCKVDGKFEPGCGTDEVEYYFNFRGYNMEYGKPLNYDNSEYESPISGDIVDNAQPLFHFKMCMLAFPDMYCYETDRVAIQHAEPCVLQMLNPDNPNQVPGAQLVYDEDVPPVEYYDPEGYAAQQAPIIQGINDAIEEAQQLLAVPPNQIQQALPEIEYVPADQGDFIGPLPMIPEIPGGADDLHHVNHLQDRFADIFMLNYYSHHEAYRARINIYPYIWFYKDGINVNYFGSYEHPTNLSLRSKWVMFKATWFKPSAPVPVRGLDEFNVGRRLLHQYEDVMPLRLQGFEYIIVMYVTMMYMQALITFCAYQQVFARAYPFIWYFVWSFVEEFAIQYLAVFRILIAILERRSPSIMLGKIIIATILYFVNPSFLQAFGLHYVYNLIAHFFKFPTFCLGDHPVGQSKEMVHTIIDASAIARYVIPSLRNNFSVGNYKGMIMDMLYVLHSFFRNCMDLNLASLRSLIYDQIIGNMKENLYKLLFSMPTKFYRHARGFTVYLYDKFNDVVASYFTEDPPLLMDEVLEEEELAFQQAGFDVLKMYAEMFSVKINTIQNSAFVNKLYNVFSTSTVIPVLRVLNLHEYIPTVYGYFEKIIAITSISQISGLIFEFFSSFLPELISGDISSHSNVITQWFTRAELLIKYGASISMLSQYGIVEGLPENEQKPAVVRMSNYVDEISRTTQDGSVLFKNTSKDSLYHGRMGQMIASLQISALTATQLLKSMRIKQRPFVLHVFGPAGIGKSTIFTAISHKVAPVLEISPTDVWQMTASNFADGYIGQKTIFIDDFNQIAFENIAAAANQMFLNITGNYPVIANMAQVDEKGKVLINPKFVFVTSNGQYANTQGIFHDSVAITRRLQYAIHVTWGNYTPVGSERSRVCARYQCYERVVRNNGTQSKIEHSDELITFDSHAMLRWVERKAQEHLAAEYENLRRISNYANIPQFRFMGALRHMYVPVPAFIANPVLRLMGIERQNQNLFYTRILNTVISPLIQHGSSLIFKPFFEYYTFLSMFFWALYESDIYLPRPRIEICQEIVVRFFMLTICDILPYGWAIHSIWNLIIYLLIGPRAIANAEMVSDNLQRYVGWKANFSIYLIALAGFVAIYWNSNSVTHQAYGDAPSEEDKEEAERVSSRLGEVKTSLVSPHPTTRAPINDRPYYAATGAAGRLEKILANTVTITASDMVTSVRQTGTGTLFGNALYTAHHVVNFDRFLLQFSHNNINHSFVIASNMVIVDPNRDQCFVIFQEVIKNTLDFTYLNSIEHYQADSFRYPNYPDDFDIKKTTMIQPSIINGKLNGNYTYDYQAILTKPTEAGMSGMPLILKTKRNVFICGVHTLLVGGTTAGGVLTTTAFMRLVGEVRSLKNGGNLITQTSTISFDGIKEVELQALHQKSILNYFTPETSRDVVPLGHFGFKPKRQKTRIRESLYFVHIMDKLNKYCLPDFSSRIVEDKWIDPFLTNLAEVGNRVKFTNIPVIRAIQDYIAKRLFETAKFPLQRNYTYMEAINGIPGIIKSIELNAAAGPGFPGNKGQYVKGYFPNAIPTCQISKTVNAYLDMLDSGVCPLFFFKASLKDEIITKKKYAEGRLRMFCGSALPMVILYRMAFGNIYAWMQHNRLVHPWKVGINCTSPEWDYSGNRLNRFLRKHMSDIRFFDKDNGIINSAIEIAVEIERLYGMDPLWIKRCSLLVVGFRHYVLEIEGALAELDSSVPSGGSGTVDFNCFTELFCEVTSMYLGFIETFKQPNHVVSVTNCFEKYDFFDNTELFNYGDDNLKSLSTNLDWYTDQHIYDGFQKLGFTITKADKTEGIPVSFTDISEAEFLKRKFRFDEELQQYVAPLEESSLWKMIGYFEDKGNISEKTFITIVTNEAFRQWWLHGRVKFNEWRDFYLSLPKEISYNPAPTYDELTIEYLDQGVKPFITWSV